MEKIGFIGVGNMGGALAYAVCRTVPSSAVYLADTFAEKVQDVHKRTGANVSDAKTITATCDYIFLGIKPQTLSALFEEIGEALADNPNAAIISMAAGVPIARLESLAGDHRPIFRIMPNTPVMAGEGMIVYTPNGAVTKDHESFFETMLSKAGDLLQIPEDQMDAACAVSGCGPAFVYMFAEALIQGGVECGLSIDCASQLACQTLVGAGKMMQGTSTSPRKLTEAVCSPGGSTIEGVHVLEESDFYNVVENTVKAAYKRAKELSNT